MADPANLASDSYAPGGEDSRAGLPPWPQVSAVNPLPASLLHTTSVSKWGPRQNQHERSSRDARLQRRCCAESAGTLATGSASASRFRVMRWRRRLALSALGRQST
eukprot:scaffold2893_cov254-Pinguiococcus_pyrenoidosus.AAC.5